jgi:hypothetical protein
MKSAAFSQVRGAVALLESLMRFQSKTSASQAEAKSILKKSTDHR